MKLKKQTIEELEKIIATDYGASLSAEELETFGASLLRLTRLATTALARADEKKISPVQAREVHSLGANTSKK